MNESPMKVSKLKEIKMKIAKLTKKKNRFKIRKLKIWEI